MANSQSNTNSQKIKAIETVYFVQAGHNGPIKIGLTSNIEKRIVSLQTANPQPLKLIHSEKGDRCREKYYHGLFQEYRINGEWFDPEGIVAHLEENDFWHKMVVWEPELRLLYEEAQEVVFKGSCISRIWYRDFKPRMYRLVGFGRKLPPRELKTSEAYHIAYQKIYHALPGCKCPGCI